MKKKLIILMLGMTLLGMLSTSLQSLEDPYDPVNPGGTEPGGSNGVMIHGHTAYLSLNKYMVCQCDVTPYDCYCRL